MNVSQSTINAVYEVITECFQYNRWFDRFVSVLGVKFACNNSANLIHHHIAHYYPAFSDKCGELLLERYNITVEYGATDAGKQDYSSVTEMIQMAEDKVIDFQNIFAGAMKIAFENNDLNVYADMMHLMTQYSPIVEQLILLNDKIGYYGEDNIMKFDHDIDKFWILGTEDVITII